MLLTLPQGRVFDTACKQDRTQLHQIIGENKKLGQSSILTSLCAQLECAPSINIVELKIYQRAKSKHITPKLFDAEYLPATTALNPTMKFFSFVQGDFYQLPAVDHISSLVYGLLDKYLYKRRRHRWHAKICITLRAIIKKFLPQATKDQEFQKILAAQETTAATYYGDYLSDDSDSEAEEQFLHDPLRQQCLDDARMYRLRCQAKRYLSAIRRLHQGTLKSIPAIDFKLRPVVHHPTTVDQRQVRQDLGAINAHLAKHGNLPQSLLDPLTTKFVVAQYRGVHYITSKWGKRARKQHRTMDERQLAQYSSVVLSSCGIATYQQYLDHLEQPELVKKLASTAATQEQQLLTMQRTQPVCYLGFVYASLFHLLQYWYSSNYDQLPKKLAIDFQQTTSHFKPYLLKPERPLLSTADVPYHALKYAYGVKLYQQYQDQRLRPRWRKNGRPERPYSGKIYLSLHPLSDYFTHCPSHITSMFKKGFVALNNLIASERETSFLSYLPANRVVLQHTAKYPSFRGSYKKLYLDKYGISSEMFAEFKQGFKAFPPHSTQRCQLKKLLGEYLCAFQEVRLIELARRHAEKMGKVLVYRSEDGGFSLNHPATPHTANHRLRREVMPKRALFKALSPENKATIRPVHSAEIIERFKELSVDQQAQKPEVMRCLFANKEELKP